MKNAEGMRKENCIEVLNRLMKISRHQMYCESVLKKNVHHSYLELYTRDGLRWIHEGIIEESSSVLVQVSLDRVLEVDIESRQLLKVNGEVVSGMEKNRVLDLSNEGVRWEGDVLHNQPYGWGVLYDKEGEMAYEGFRIGNVSVCYGMQYYADIGVKEYEGEILRASDGEEANSMTEMELWCMMENG